MAILDTISAMSDNIKSCYNIVRINGGLIPENKNIENLPMAINSMFFDRTQTTHYTQEDVDNSEGTLIPIGKTKPLYVIAALTDSGATCTITRNGDNSDGIIADYDNGNNKSPFYESSVVNLIFKSGIFYSRKERRLNYENNHRPRTRAVYQPKSKQHKLCGRYADVEAGAEITESP